MNRNIQIDDLDDCYSNWDTIHNFCTFSRSDFPLFLGMKTFTVEFAYDGNKVVADCVKIVTDNEVQYQLTPQNKDLLKKYGETIFRQKEGEFLSGEPIVDLAYFSALKEGLENYLYDKKE